MPQLILNFLDMPLPQKQNLWDGLNHEQQQLIVEALAPLMLKAARATQTPPTKEAPSD